MARRTTMSNLKSPCPAQARHPVHRLDEGVIGSPACAQAMTPRWYRANACSFVPARLETEPLLDARHQHLAHRAVGVEPLLTAALGVGRVGRRPVFDFRRDRAREVERLVMRLRRERDD